MKRILSALSVAALAGCSDGGWIATAPSSGPVQRSVGARENTPLRDALERIVPTFGPSAAASVLASVLTAAQEHRSDTSLGAIEAALQRLINENPDAAPEADVIRLAVAAER